MFLLFFWTVSSRSAVCGEKSLVRLVTCPNRPECQWGSRDVTKFKDLQVYNIPIIQHLSIRTYVNRIHSIRRRSYGMFNVHNYNDNSMITMIAMMIMHTHIHTVWPYFQYVLTHLHALYLRIHPSYTQQLTNC